MKNKTAKEILIELYGPECFIDKLHLRVDNQPKRYKSKKQLKIMKTLTYHHIKEKRNGGKATVENGALLSEENHQWFNKQSPEVQAELNRKFQEYKRCQLEIVDKDVNEISPNININAICIDTKQLIVENKNKTEPYSKSHTETYNRAKTKRDTQKQVEEVLCKSYKGDNDEYVR